MQFPSFSPYVAFGANPVNFVDPFGNSYSKKKEGEYEGEQRTGTKIERK